MAFGRDNFLCHATPLHNLLLPLVANKTSPSGRGLAKRSMFSRQEQSTKVAEPSPVLPAAEAPRPMSRAG